MNDFSWMTVVVSAITSLVVSVGANWINSSIKGAQENKQNKQKARQKAKILKEELDKNLQVYNKKLNNMSLKGVLESEFDGTSIYIGNVGATHINSSSHDFDNKIWKSINGDIAVLDIELFDEIDWVYQRFTHLKTIIPNSNAQTITLQDIGLYDIMFKGFTEKYHHLYSKLFD